MSVLRRLAAVLWAVATSTAVVSVALIVVAAGAFVALLSYDRVLFLIVLTVLTTNTATWGLSRSAMRAELEENRRRIDALTPASLTAVGDDLDPPANLFPGEAPPPRTKDEPPPVPPPPPDHVDTWRHLDAIARRLD